MQNRFTRNISPCTCRKLLRASRPFLLTLRGGLQIARARSLPIHIFLSHSRFRAYPQTGFLTALSCISRTLGFISICDFRKYFIGTESSGQEPSELGLQERYEMAFQTAEPKIKPQCPKCGSTEIVVRCDAYASYKLLGFDTKGDEFLATEADVQTFDDRVFICGSCNFEDTKSDVFFHAGMVASLLKR